VARRSRKRTCLRKKKKTLKFNKDTEFEAIKRFHDHHDLFNYKKYSNILNVPDGVDCRGNDEAATEEQMAMKNKTVIKRRQRLILLAGTPAMMLMGSVIVSAVVLKALLVVLSMKRQKIK